MLLLYSGIVFLVVYFYLKYKYNYWNRMGVVNPPAQFFLGNLGEGLRLKKNMGQIYGEIYNKYPGHAFVGFFKMLTPGILLRSPDMIKKVLVQDYEYFQSNDFEITEQDTISAKNPFLQTGAKWKKTRSQVTPAFSSGKIKSMVPLTQKASNNLIEYIAANLELTQNKGMEARDLFGKYTTDNTASCAFGLEANSFDESKAEFREMGKKVFGSSFLVALKFTIITIFPKITEIMKLKFIPISVSDYFHNVIVDVLKYRKDNSEIRPDFLHLMTQLREKLGDAEFGMDDITSHSIQFFVNGMESSASTMCYFMYSLANNLDVQNKLREEMDRVLEKYNGEITYEALQEMEYMEKVFNESMRLYPVAHSFSKRCTKTYTFPKTEQTEALTIHPGTPVMISPLGLHHDEQYFPNPQKFDPERFSEENKQTIPKFVFMPFGDGPRICLGQRFAIVQVKIGIARLIKEFEVRIHKRTVQPLRMNPKTFLSTPLDGVYLSFYKRK